MKLSIRLILAFFAFLFSTLYSFGQTTSWTGSASTSWTNSSNWTGGVPTSSLDVVIGDRSLPRYPTISGTANAKSLTIGGTNTATLTLNSNLTVLNNVTINSNGTLSHGASTLTVSGNWTGIGTYTGLSTSNVTLAGTSQAISGANATFKNLTINAGSTVTLNEDLNIDVACVVNGTVDPNESPTYMVSGPGSLTVASGGTVHVKGANAGSNYSISGSATLSAGSTVDYSATTNQTITNFTYSTIRISGSGIKSLTGSLPALISTSASVGNIYVASGTLDLGAYTIARGTTVAGGTLSVSDGAKLIIGGTNGLPSNYATTTFGTTSTVEYDGTAQVITPDIYGNLTLSGSGTFSITGGAAVTAAGNFSISGGTFNVISNASAPSTTVNITGNLLISSTGKINLESVSSASGVAVINVDGDFISTGTSVAASGRSGGVIDFGTGTITNNAINIKGDFSKSGVGTFGTTNATTSGAKGFVFTGTTTQSFSYSGASSQYMQYTVNAGATLQMATGLSLLSGTTPRSTFTVNGAIDMGVSSISAASANPNFTLGATGNFITANTLGLNGSLTSSWNSKTFTAGSDFEFNSTVASQSFGISGLTLATPGTILVSNTGGIVTADASVTFGNSGSLIVNSGSSLNAGAFLFTYGLSGSATINGTLFTSNTNGFSGNTSATIKSTNTPAVTLGTSSTIEYNGSGSQTITAGNYNHLTSSNTGARILATVGTIGIAGTFTPGTNTYTNTSSTISFNGLTAQSIPAFSFNNLTISNTAGATLTGNANVATTLAFTNGIIATGSNVLSLASAATVSGAAAGKYVNGNLLWSVPTGAPTRVFAIGDAANYTPVTVVFSSVTVAGNLTAVSKTPDQPNLSGSGIRTDRSVNRYWTLSNGGMTFTTAAITMNWLAADMDASVATANFKIGRYSAGWTFPTVASPLATSIQATGVASFGDFAIGELCSLNSGFSYSGSPFCSSASPVTPTITGTAGTFTSTPAGLTINAGTGVITLTTSTAGTYTVTNTVTGGGCSSSTPATVTVTAAPSATIGYTGSPFCTSASPVSVNLVGTAGGTYTSSPGGLTISSTTGTITPSTSSAGTYTITYTIAAAGGCSAITPTASVTITTAPSATIGYTGSPFCTSVSPVSVNLVGTAGGTYTSSPAGLTISSTTGTITPSTSAAGTYTITYTIAAAGGCSGIAPTTSVTITAAPSATIGYTGSPFCTSVAPVTVNRTGTAGGTYTSTPAGLTISSTTGTITPSTSSAGTYTITYTVAAAGGCSAITPTASVTITTAPSATIGYTGSPFCTSVSPVSVNLVGTGGGTYTSTPAGLTISSTTGTVTPSTSSAGTYTITYTIAASGNCSAIAPTASVTITTAPAATISYAGSPYTNTVGTATVTLTGTAGGVYSSTAGLSLNASTGAVTRGTSSPGTYTVTYTVAAAGGCSAITPTAVIIITSAVTKYYVNDNSTTGSVYTTAVGSDANAGTSSAPYLTINYAIAHANAGDTIYVDAGTYGEQVDANKAITILGANAAISPNTGTRGAESILYNATGGSMTITTLSRVVIKGFRVTSTTGDAMTSNTTGHRVTFEKMFFDGSTQISFFSSDTLILADNRFNNVINGGDKSVFIQGNYNGTTGSFIQVYNNTWINSGSGGMNISSARGDIYNNTFSNIAYLGILVANLTSVNVTRNVFTGITNPDLSVSTWGAGVRFYSPAAGMVTSITNNFFIGNYVGVATRPTDVVTGLTININNNSFSGNTLASINHTGSGLLQATCNWFGSSNSGVFSPGIIGNVNYAPFLTSGTDNDLVTAGFQPIPGNCAGYLTRWTGAVNSTWTTAGNWTNSVPNSSFDVIIPTGLSVYPTINSGTVSVKNLTVQSGASLTVAAAILQIAGGITNSGSINASTGEISMNGSSAQTIPAGAFVNNNLFELDVNNTAGVTLAGTLNIIDILEISAGTLTTGDFLTLKSSATNTARVATITSVAATPIIGNVTVERYIQGRRKYRLVTSSVTTSASATLVAGQESQSIWGNWQNQGNNTTPNVGTIITGGTVANGFDPQTANASLYTYNAATKKFIAFNSASGKNTKYTPLKAGQAYYMFVYGDRLNSISTSSPNATVLKATGTLATGDQVYDNASAIPLSNVVGAYTLIGNPYASIIDWKSISKSNVEKTIWGWDANLNSTGGYVAVTATGTGALISPLSDKIKVNQYVQPGQGFFVQTKKANPSITITEYDKVDDAININSTVFRTTEVAKQPLMAINLLYNSGGNTLLADGALSAFDAAYLNLVDGDDALKIVNSLESVAIANGTDLLSIDARTVPKDRDTIFLNLARLTKPQYTLQIFAKDMTVTGALPYLEDNYLHTVSPLVLTDTNSVVFNVIAGDAASSDMNRFRIVFRQLVSLPVKFTSIKAAQKDKNVEVDWSVGEESGIQKYEVQRSFDGINFTKAGEVVTTGNNNIATYNWIDVNPLPGYNYYRILALETNGQSFLSRVVSVKIDAAVTLGKLSVYPNPVTNHQFNVRLEQMEKGEYSVLMFNLQGQQVINRIIYHEGGSSNQNVPLDSTLAAGVYYLKISNQTKKKAYSQTLIIE